MTETEDNFQRILVGVDQSADAQKAFHFAIRRAQQTHAQLLIVSVFEKQTMNVYEALNDDYVRNKREDVEKDLQQYIATAQAAGVQDVRGIISEGNQGEKIVEDIIPQYQPDLLIIGSLDKKGPQRFFGSQAAYMAKRDPISVLVIR